MKFHANSTSETSTNKFFQILALFLFISIPLYLLRNSRPPLLSLDTDIDNDISSQRKINELSMKFQPPLPSPEIDANISSKIKSNELSEKPQAPLPSPKCPYYTNESCPLIIDQHNCMKFGRPDTEFMRWRWQPDGCELPYFDAAQFLELVRGKSMAFVGDSGEGSLKDLH